MVLATKPEASSNFQATMADCSDLDSESVLLRGNSYSLQKQHGQRS